MAAGLETICANSTSKQECTGNVTLTFVRCLCDRHLQWPNPIERDGLVAGLEEAERVPSDRRTHWAPSAAGHVPDPTPGP